MVKAANHLHDLKGKPLNDIIDTVATLDGTWQKRGHSSLFDVLMVISWSGIGL